MSESNSNDLSQELAAMSDVFADLGERLLGAARQIHSPGTPPPNNLLEELASTRSAFEGLRDRVRGLGESLEVACPPPESLDTLQGLNALTDEIAAAEIRRDKAEELRRASIGILERVLRLTHASSPEFGPLRERQEHARGLHESLANAPWSNLPEEAHRLSEGDHPFAKLVVLVEQHDELEDEHWGYLHEAVGEAFGKALAAAAARSKLVLPAEETPASDDDESGASAPGDRPSGGRRNLGRATPSSR